MNLKAIPVRILISCFLGLQTLVALAVVADSPLILTSWASSSALIAMLRGADAASPRCVFGGHIVSTLAGMAMLLLFGPTPWAIGLGVALAVAAMWLGGMVHPPAAANAAIAMVIPTSMPLLGAVTLGGALGLAAIAWALWSREQQPAEIA